LNNLYVYILPQFLKSTKVHGSCPFSLTKAPLCSSVLFKSLEDITIANLK